MTFTDHTWLQRNRAELALGGTAVVAFLAARYGFVPIDLQQLTAERLGTLFLTLIFAALVIERAVEVYVNNVFNRPRDDLLARQWQLEEQWKQTIKAIENETKRVLDATEQGREAVGTQAALEKLRLRADDLHEKLADERVARGPELIALRAKKGAVAAVVATTLGVAVAAAGLRIFDQLATKELPVTLVDGATRMVPLLAENQLTVFRAVDVAVTALLLAGGADGIHKVLNRFLSQQQSIASTVQS